MIYLWFISVYTNNNTLFFCFRTFDDDDQKDGVEDKFEFDVNFFNDSTSDPAINQENLFRSTSCKSTTPNRYNTHSFDVDNPSLDYGTGDDYHHTSLDSHNQGKDNRKVSAQFTEPLVK